MTVERHGSRGGFLHPCPGFREGRRPRGRGEEYEHLFGVFGLRVRAVRLRLGEEQLELMQFLGAPRTTQPIDSHSNDRWFQHIAIIVSDMSAAYARLQSQRRDASSGPQRLPDWNPTPGGIEAFYFRDPDGHNLEVLAFPPDKGPQVAREERRGCSSASITRPSSCPIPRQACIFIATCSGCASRHERKLWHGAGAPEQCVWRASTDHCAAGNPGARRRVSRIPLSTQRATDAGGYPGK